MIKEAQSIASAAEYVPDHEKFGRAAGLQGEMATVCLFKKCLQDDQIKQIFVQGKQGIAVFCFVILGKEIYRSAL